jgi:hypothetical protein
MKLKAVPSLPSMKLAGRVPGDLHADLIAYAEYYKEALGEPTRGSNAPDLHAFRSRLSVVASSAPHRRRVPCRRDAERRAGERVAAWRRFSDGEGERKIKAEGRMAPKCPRPLSGARPSMSADAIQPSRREGRLRASPDGAKRCARSCSRRVRRSGDARPLV